MHRGRSGREAGPRVYPAGGRGLNPRLWYAPGHQAAMHRLPVTAWEELHRELLEDEEGAA